MAIAAPRYMGAFGAAIGLQTLQQYGWLQDFEVYSGGAMALLEGFALAFVLAKWRLLKPGEAQWYVLLTMVLILALCVPLVALPYLLVEQLGVGNVSQVFGEAFVLQILWSFVVLAVPMFVIMAVGFADVNEYERIASKAKQQAAVKQSQQRVKQAQAKPFACDACSEAFTSQKALNGHRAHCKPKANGVSKEWTVRQIGMN